MAIKPPQLVVVGLGNPGGTYAATRHNAGFMALDSLATHHGIQLATQEYGAIYGQGKIAGRCVVLAKPWRFMNRSGDPVAELLQHLASSVQELLVIYDDMDLELGRIQIKQKGGHGGHKGLQSIMEAIGGGEFVRLRLGIGRPPIGIDPVEFVLEPFAPHEHCALAHMLEKAREAVVAILAEGPQHGMNRFNRKRAAVST